MERHDKIELGISLSINNKQRVNEMKEYKNKGHNQMNIQ